MITTATALSSDGVKFTVKIYARSESQAKVAASMKTLHASRRTAAQLDEADDYTRVPTHGIPTNHDDLIAPEELFEHFPAYPTATATVTPPKKGKPALTLIPGGKK